MQSLSSNPLRVDPSKTLTLRRRMGAEYARRIGELISDIVKLVGEEDVFGLNEPDDPSVLIYHFNPNHDERGRFAEVAYGKLKGIPEAEEDYRHFDEGDQIRLKDLGFKGMGTGYTLPTTEKLDKIKQSMSLDPKDTYYTQSSVIREAVVRKIDKRDPELPLAIKVGNEYHLQHGHHRAAAEFLLYGRFNADVIEKVGGKWKRSQLVSNTRWRHIGNAAKVQAFREWLQDQIDKRLMSHDKASQVWTERYIKAAYERGRVRGTSQAARLRRRQYEKEFLVRYNRAQQKKVELLVQESLEDSKNISTRMATRAGKIIAEGLTKRQSPRTLAKRLADELGIEKNRARLIAQTELVRAQAEGQLDAYEEFDIRKVGALVEWTTAGDSKVCPKCQKKAGKVFTIRQARGLIPLHPGCRCAWEPVEGETSPGKRLRRRK